MNRRGREPIDGVLLLDKGSGLTSNDALIRARRLYNAAKAGHGGTLDPMATGLLPVLLGEATKFADDLLGADKTYLAEITLGLTTDTGDAEGRPLASVEADCDQARFAACAARFMGRILQIPPMYSALKRDGRALYEYARAGQTVERAAREVTIHALDVLFFDAPTARIRVTCSKGTYVRVLAEDIGACLGCGAHLSGLRREAVGGLSLTSAVTLDTLRALTPGQRIARLLPADALLSGLPALDLDRESTRRFAQGQRVRVDAQVGVPEPGRVTSGGRVRVYGEQVFLGVGLLADAVLAPHRLVANPSTNKETQR